MSKKNGILSNLSWKFAERMLAQMITLIVAVILARLLEPSDYGIVSIVMVFITLANVFVSDGFGSALIQKKDADATDFYTVLYFNIGFSVVIYLIVFFVAPYIAAFYGEGYEILTPVLRVLGLRIIVSGVNSVQNSYVSRKMMFQKFFIATLVGTVISAIVGIAMAYSGFGVWALVGQYLVNTTVNTITLAITFRKKVRFVFNPKRLKPLFDYGVKILGTKLLITGYQELRALIIGKLYSSNDLAYYDQGRKYPSLVVTNINTAIDAVLFPSMAKQQDHKENILNMVRRSIRFSSYVMSPLMLGLAAIAEPFVRIVLTEKWLPCVPMLQIFCVIFLFQPIHTANMQAIKAVGRSDVLLKLEIIKKSIELVTLLMVMRMGVVAIAINMAVLTTLFTFVNAYPNKKLLDYPFKEQIKDILPNVINASVMMIVVGFLGRINIAPIPLMIIQIFVGGCVYLLLSVVTKNKEYDYIKNLTISILKKNK